jgi:predicted ATP-binding protein involved in virulence/Tfp pilus assembly protein PilF
MGIIDQKLNDYVWDNLNKLESLFSEIVYTFLSRFKNKEDKKGFKGILEVVLDNKELLEKIKSGFEDIENLSLKEITKALEIQPKVESYEKFIYKEKYINRAKYWVEKSKEKNEDYVLLLNNLAQLYSLIGEDEKAEPLYIDALKLRKKLFGEEHLDTVISYDNLGELYYSMESYEKAEELYQKALKLRKKLFGEEHLETTISYDNLGELYYSMESYEKAEEFYQKALKIRENFLGKEHLDTATNYNNLAFIYVSMKEYKQAKPLYKKALEITKKELGIEHPDTLRVIANIEKSKPPFKINKIKIENFKQFNAPFSMQFSKQINIIIGQNAIGKTTLLQAITLGLLKEDSLDAKKVEYDDYISKGKDRAKLIIYDNDEEKRIEILKEKRKIEENYFIPFILAYGSNFFTSKLNEVKEVAQGIVNETIHKDFTTSIFVDYTSGFVNPIQLLEFLDLEKDEKVAQIQQTFIEIINSFLEGFELVANDKNYYFQKDKEKTQLRLRLEDLSEGYRGNVLLITDMLIKILGFGYTPEIADGVVLIDEFDKHLHPRWQSKLVNQLTETFPKIQFIMTTHNPMSILDRNVDEVTKLVETKEGIKAVQGRGTKSIDVSTVLLEYFNVDSVVGQSMQDKIRRFNELRINNQTDNEEYKLLNDEILNSEFGAMTFDADYLEYLKSKKKKESNKKRNFDDIGDFL